MSVDDDDESTTSDDSVSETTAFENGSSNLPASDDFGRHFEIGQQRRKEVFSADERDRQERWERAENRRDAAEGERTAQFIQDERSRDEQAAASQTYRSKRFERVEETRNEAETIRGQQYSTAQTLRASAFRETRVWDAKRYVARVALETMLLQTRQGQVQNVYDDFLMSADRARVERRERFKAQTIRAANLGQIPGVGEPGVLSGMSMVLSSSRIRTVRRTPLNYVSQAACWAPTAYKNQSLTRSAVSAYPAYDATLCKFASHS